ncbi:MAG: RagB/SusD family nutrient uptake outer membrane protein [Prevotella sp.]|nr:RagB/SusD family nutrient uptake outer membrane protein [Prevotella sp.]
MKKYIFGLSMMALGMLFASCSDNLDEQPDSRWIHIDSSDKVAKLLTSGYPSSVPAVICELMGDNLVDNNVVVPATHNDAYSLFHEEAYKWEDINSYSTSEDDTPLEIWDKYYFGIATANHAIAAMKEMSADPAHDPELAHSWGEAHIMRAYFHFVLVNVFAEAYKDETKSAEDWGIPYVTTVEEVVRVDYSKPEYRKKVSEVYALIEKDIKEGIDLIDDSKYTVPAYHFNRNAAYAFAARFYLFKRDYQNCLKYADMALGANPATSLRKWASMSANTINSLLNDYNDEKAPCNYLLLTTYSLQDRMLSACRYAINSGAKNVKVKMAGTGDNATVNIAATKDLLYEGGGPNWSSRVPAFDGKIYRWGAGSEYGSWLFRVYEYFEYTNKIAGIGYVHIIYQPFTAEETLLCRAEAKLYLGDRAGAIQDLGAWTASKMIDSELTQTNINNKYKGTADDNIFVNDMHPDKMSSEFKVLTGDDLNVLNCILHFRRIETMFEGMRWFDIKRYGITVKHVYRGPQDYDATCDVLEWNDPRRVIQIPYNAVDAGYPSSDRALGTNDGNDMRTLGYSVVQ